MTITAMGSAPTDPNALRRQLMAQILSQGQPASTIGGAIGEGLATLAQAWGGKMAVDRAQTEQDTYRQGIREAILGAPGEPQMGDTLPGDEGGLRGMTRGPGSTGMAPDMDPQMVEAMMATPGGSDALVAALFKQKMSGHEQMTPYQQGQLDISQKRLDMDREKAGKVAPPRVSSLAQDLIAAGLKPGTPEFRNAVLSARTKQPRARGSDNVLQEIYDPESPTGSRFVSRAEAKGQPGMPPSGLQIETGPDGTVRVTQGRTASTEAKGQTPEAAAKTQLVEQGAENVAALRGMLFDEQGGLNRILVGKMALGIPGEGREATRMINQAIRAKVRIETGAAISDEEIASEYGQFFPSVTDSPENTAGRLDQLEKFLRGTSARINPPKAGATQGLSPSGQTVTGAIPSLDPKAQSLMDRYAPVGAP